jgi:hypothetical protein
MSCSKALSTQRGGHDGQISPGVWLYIPLVQKLAQDREVLFVEIPNIVTQVRKIMQERLDRRRDLLMTVLLHCCSCTFAH